MDDKTRIEVLEKQLKVVIRFLHATVNNTGSLIQGDELLDQIKKASK